MLRRWPDTDAGYGQLELVSPAGETLDLALLPLSSRGPTLKQLLAHDAASLAQPVQTPLLLPAGRALRLSGTFSPVARTGQFVYLQRRNVVYRFLSTATAQAADGTLSAHIAASLHVPAAPPLPPPPPSATPPQPPVSSCCHCPAWGTGWGTVLTSLNGIPVYSNAGNLNNGCVGTYGILYQCVELVQRYFAQRWGYPPIWRGVLGAADMVFHPPAGVTFIPNGGAPGPRAGDAVVFYGGVFGHVALIQQVDRHIGRIAIVEENWSLTGTARLQLLPGNTIAIRNSAYGSYMVAGWLQSAQNAAPSTEQ